MVDFNFTNMVPYHLRTHFQGSKSISASMSEANHLTDQLHSSESSERSAVGDADRARRLEPGCYFSDGIRKIDFVLVWEEDLEPRANAAADSKEDRRKRFEDNLHYAGVEVEEEVSDSDTKRIYFLKLFVPWDVMCYYAEYLRLRAPLQVQPRRPENWSSRALKCLGVPNLMDQDAPNPPLQYYTCSFRKSKLSRFLGSENPATFFTATQRHQVAYEILSTLAYGDLNKSEVGIDRLLEEDVYSGAFPLHEGPYQVPEGGDWNPEDLNPRQVLYAYWAKWGLWYKYQPLDHIREYFGEKIGLYFAWLGLYTACLFPVSMVGLAVFIYGCFTFASNVPTNEVCASKKTYKMCPKCDDPVGCLYWYLSDACADLFTRFSYLFDHGGTVFYSVFVTLWAVVFLESWKRKSATLTHQWDVMDFMEDEERPRPEYAARCLTYHKNPVTGQHEPYFPSRMRIPRVIAGVSFILFMTSIVIIFIVAVITYRVLIYIAILRNPQARSGANTVASVSAGAANFIIIESLSLLYKKLAYKLTQWEMHRTQSEFDDQFTLKVSIFEFVNIFSSLTYIAFFKGKFTGYPGQYSTFFDLRNEDCQHGGCVMELALQLAIIMIARQIGSNIMEIFLPKFCTWIHRRKKGLRSEESQTQCMADYYMIPYEGLVDEYLEMVVQFGFITIFVAAFPLAPFFALLNNWLEIRLDASKLVCETRRPVAERARDIGVWFTLLDVVMQLAIISNACLIAFTSEFIPKEVYKYEFGVGLHGYTNFSLAWSPANSTTELCRYHAFRDENGNFTVFYWKVLTARLAFVIVFEHVVFFVSRMLDILIPDIPGELQVNIKREHFLAKQALMDAEFVEDSSD